jgi:hypothetical protein
MIYRSYSHVHTQVLRHLSPREQSVVRLPTLIFLSSDLCPISHLRCIPLATSGFDMWNLGAHKVVCSSLAFSRSWLRVSLLEEKVRLVLQKAHEVLPYSISSCSSFRSLSRHASNSSGFMVLHGRTSVPLNATHTDQSQLFLVCVTYPS